MDSKKIYAERMNAMEQRNNLISYTPQSVKVSTAAKIMDTSTRVVRNLIKTGYIRAMKMPSLTISTKELERFIDWATETQFDFSEFGRDDFSVEKHSRVVELKKRGRN